MSCCNQKTCPPTPTYSVVGTPQGVSAVQEILALANRPEVISFGGGLPAPEGFPVR